MSKTISFRNMLADGGQDRIKLTTLNGKKGYRIVNFAVMTSEPGEHQHESTVKVYKKEQSSVDNTVDFNDATLLAAAAWNSGNSQGGQDALWVPLVQIFDNEIFNQDIYVTHSETDGSNPINYYIELEVMDLTDIQATQLTLKSLRTIASR
jgi:hypothetical protein